MDTDKRAEFITEVVSENEAAKKRIVDAEKKGREEAIAEDDAAKIRNANNKLIEDQNKINADRLAELEKQKVAARKQVRVDFNELANLSTSGEVNEKTTLAQAVVMVKNNKKK